MFIPTTALLVICAATAAAHSQASFSSEGKEEWESKYGGTPDLPFSGITGFARLPHAKCLDEPGRGFDIGILGIPFDTAVSYRPGARFGPQAIRAGSRRHGPYRSFLMPWGFSALQSGLDIIDCNDVPVSPYDPTLAIDEIEVAYSTLLARPVSSDLSFTSHLAKDGKEHPRLVSLGGDHTIVLPILAALHKVYGPISVLHFDAHLDTWNGFELAGGYTDASKVTHGTFFWKASEKGYIANGTSIHAGIRTRLSTAQDLIHDEQVGFALLTTDDIDDMGPEGIGAAIRSRVGDTPVYLSFDIDTIDPSMAPATGTPESGGWTTREVKRIVRSLAGLNLVGADIVEVAPAYDTNAELTSMAAADLVQELVALMTGEQPRPAMKKGVLDQRLRETQAKSSHDEL